MPSFMAQDYCWVVTPGKGLLSTTSAGANRSTRVVRTAEEEAILQEPRPVTQSVCTCVCNSR